MSRDGEPLAPVRTLITPPIPKALERPTPAFSSKVSSQARCAAPRRKRAQSASKTFRIERMVHIAGMLDADHATSGAAGADLSESHKDRARRHAHRGKLYATAFTMAALIVAIVALVLANTRRVEVSWVFGSTLQSLAWIVVVTALLGWLLGIATSVLFRRRARAHQH